MLPPETPTVLVVDDNVEFAGLLGTLLAEQGIQPIVAHTAGDGLTRLRQHRPAVVLVDLLLPDMTGHKLIELIVREGPPPPLFVMSGVFRGMQQREKVERTARLEGWYEKPFDTRLLVEQVVRLIGHDVKDRRAHKRVGEVTGDFDINILEPVDDGVAVSQDADLDLDIDIEVVEESGPQPSWEGRTELSDHPPRRGSGPGRRDSGAFDAISTGFGRAHSASPAEVAAGLRTSLRTGSLETTTMPRLLNAFFVAQETGEIVFERGDVRKIVYFESGVPTYAVSNQDSERLGAIARQAAGIDSSKVETAVRRARDSEQLTGDVMVQLGLIDEAARAEMLAEQTRAIIRSLFTWERGRYVIGFKVRTHIHPVRLNEDTAALVINGVRDLFELDRLRRLLPSGLRPRPSPNPPVELYQLPLTDPEAMLLLKATGDLDVEELVELIHPALDARGARALVYGLLTLGVLVRD